MSTAEPKRITLNDSERALLRRLPDRTGYVAIVNFRGPRGRNYVPIRTAAYLTIELAEKAAADIRGRRYKNNAMPIGTELYAVDALGRVVA